MSKPKMFEVVADLDSDETGTWKLRAGVGCIALSIGWVVAALALAAALFVRACS